MTIEKIEALIKKHGFTKENSVLEIQDLPNSANETFIVTIRQGESCNKIFLKMYTPFEGRAVKNCELWIRDILPLSVQVPLILVTGFDSGKNYLISSFVEGVTLLEKVTQPFTPSSDFIFLSEQIIGLIRNCAAVSVDGFGSLDRDSRKGQYSTLTEFVKNNINNAYNLFKQVETQDEEVGSCVDKYLAVLNHYLEDHRDYFDLVSSKLIPLDLNLNNFIVNADNKVIMTDLESFAGGDPLLAFGECYAHVYLSPFGDCFASEYSNFSEDEQETIHFYALLSSFNVFCFCIAHQVPNLKELTPWGNSNTFLDLMAAHEEKIDFYKKRISYNT